ncbi:hypothetical protein FHS27_000683 [Rhodopirellula rubra]|uniref:Uncharacterized protein n=1 Tax=Aporhodopirellula rubra TaxID=980271 RepID=A0A7W5DUQ9_9BACT|nr:hypothetical protein [Aporhodopirellula rubra]
MDSTPAVGSCVLPPRGNAPNEVGPFRSTMVLCCCIEKHSAKGWSETRVTFVKASGAGLEPAGPFGRAMYSEPAAECVSMCCVLK